MPPAVSSHLLDRVLIPLGMAVMSDDTPVDLPTAQHPDAVETPPRPDGASAEAVEAGHTPAGDPPAGDLPTEEIDLSLHRFECRSCGYVYDPGEGVKKLGIEPGTAFFELDAATFRCPVCRSKVGAFKDIGPRNKPSGFEENLNFGLGVNRLTPGQKNVLIFGSFALAIAFFLSLYSLH
jgi:rubredoxin